MTSYAEKVEGVINCGVIDCFDGANAKVCKNQRRKYIYQTWISYTSQLCLADETRR